MKVVFYSTNSNFFDGSSVHFTNIPSYSSQLKLLSEKYSCDKFLVVTQIPGMFLLDLNNSSLEQNTSGIEYIITDKTSAEDIAELIASFSPDLAIAATFWVAPFDWLGVKDSMVAAALEKRGIKVRCGNTEFEAACFDKWKTHELLEKEGFDVAPAVYVRHDLYWAERKTHEIKTNVYKEYILDRIRRLRFPVVIKDTVGLSSYGMEVVKTYAQAKAFLDSKKNSSDRIVEEYIDGIQFGAEIYAADGKYTVFPPFMFSVNKYGITSPKQSVKLGPVTNPAYRIEELKSSLSRLAEKCRISGVVQVDLVFDGRKWFIIEINPRLSGMSCTTACSAGCSVLELLYNPPEDATGMKYVFDLKFPVLNEEQLKKLKVFPSVLYISQTVNDAARQIREGGFCEVIFGGRNSAEALKDDLLNLRNSFSEIMENTFFENAEKMLEKL